MEISFIYGGKTCTVLVRPSTRWEDQSASMDFLLKDEIYGKTDEEALGNAIAKYRNWINHGDIIMKVGRTNDK